MKSIYEYAYWKVPTLELLVLGAIFLNCWSFRFFGVLSPCWRNCTVLL